MILTDIQVMNQTAEGTKVWERAFPPISPLGNTPLFTSRRPIDASMARKHLHPRELMMWR